MATITNIIKTVFRSDGAQGTADDVARINRNMTRLGQTSVSAGRSFAAQSQGLGGLVAAYAGAAATTFALQQAFDKLAQSARAIQTLEGLTTLAVTSGESANTILDSVQRITKGQLTLVESAQQANLALSAGFDTAQIEGLATVALKASRALGRDLNDAYTRVIRGSAKLETELLDELGIYTKIDPATRAYAAAIGKSASELTEFERRQAFVNSVIDEGNRKFSSINTSVPTAAEKIEAFGSNIINLSTQLGALLAENLAPVAEFFTTNLTASISAFGAIAGLVASKGVTVLREGLNSLVVSIQASGAAAEVSTRQLLGIGRGTDIGRSAIVAYQRELVNLTAQEKSRFSNLQKQASTRALSFSQTREAVRLLDKERKAIADKLTTLNADRRSQLQSIQTTRRLIQITNANSVAMQQHRATLNAQRQALENTRQSLLNYRSALNSVTNAQKDLNTVTGLRGGVAGFIGSAYSAAATQVSILGKSITGIVGAATGLFSLATTFTFLGSSIAAAAGKAEEFDAFVQALASRAKNLVFNKSVIDDTDTFLSLTSKALTEVENLDLALKEKKSFIVETTFLGDKVEIEKTKELLVKEVSSALGEAGREGGKNFFEALLTFEGIGYTIGARLGGTIIGGLLGIPFGPAGVAIGAKIGGAIGTALGAVLGVQAAREVDKATRTISDQRIAELEQLADLDPGSLGSNDRIREATALLDAQNGEAASLSAEGREYLATQLKLLSTYEGSISSVRTLTRLAETLGVSAAQIQERFKIIENIGPVQIVEPDLTFLGEELEVKVRLAIIDDEAISNITKQITDAINSVTEGNTGLLKNITNAIGFTDPTAVENLNLLNNELENQQAGLTTLQSKYDQVASTFNTFSRAIIESQVEVSAQINKVNTDVEKTKRLFEGGLYYNILNERTGAREDALLQGLLDRVSATEDLVELQELLAGAEGTISPFKDDTTGLSEIYTEYTNLKAAVSAINELTQQSEQLGESLSDLENKTATALGGLTAAISKQKEGVASTIAAIDEQKAAIEKSKEPLESYLSALNAISSSSTQNTQATAIYVNALQNLSELAGSGSASLEQLEQAQKAVGAAFVRLSETGGVANEQLEALNSSTEALAGLSDEQLNLIGIEDPAAFRDEISTIIASFSAIAQVQKDSAAGADAAIAQAYERLEPLKEELALQAKLLEQNKELSKPVKRRFETPEAELQAALEGQLEVFKARKESLQAEQEAQNKINMLTFLNVGQRSALIAATNEERDSVLASIESEIRANAENKSVLEAQINALGKLTFLTAQQKEEAKNATLAAENYANVLGSAVNKAADIVNSWKSQTAQLERELSSFLAKDRIVKLKLELEGAQLDAQILQQQLQNQISAIQGEIKVTQAEEEAGLTSATDAAVKIAELNQQAVGAQQDLVAAQFAAAQAEIDARQAILAAETQMNINALESERQLTIAKIDADKSFIDALVGAYNGLLTGTDNANRSLVTGLANVFSQLTQGIANAFPSQIGDLAVKRGEGTTISPSYESTIAEIENTFEGAYEGVVAATNDLFDARILAELENSAIKQENLAKERELESLRHDEKVQNLNDEARAQALQDQAAIDEAKKGKGGGGKDAEKELEKALDKIREAQKEIAKLAKEFIEGLLSLVSDIISFIGQSIQDNKQRELDNILQQEEQIKDALAFTTENLNSAQSELNDALSREATLKEEVTAATEALAEAQQAFFDVILDGDVAKASQEFSRAILDRNRKIIELDRTITERIALEGKVQSLEDQKITQEQALKSITEERLTVEKELQRVQEITNALTGLVSQGLDLFNQKLGETYNQLQQMIGLGVPNLGPQVADEFADLRKAIQTFNGGGLSGQVAQGAVPATTAVAEGIKATEVATTGAANQILGSAVGVMQSVFAGAQIGSLVGQLIGDTSYASTIGGAIGAGIATIFKSSGFIQGITSAVSNFAGGALASVASSIVTFGFALLGALIFGGLFGKKKKKPEGVVSGIVSEAGVEITDTKRKDGFQKSALKSIVSVIEQVYDGILSTLDSFGISFVDSFGFNIKNREGEFDKVVTYYSTTSSDLLDSALGQSQAIEAVDSSATELADSSTVLDQAAQNITDTSETVSANLSSGFTSIADTLFEGARDVAEGAEALDSAGTRVGNVFERYKAIQELQSGGAAGEGAIRGSAGRSAQSLAEEITAQFFKALRVIRDETGAVIFRSLIVDALVPNRADLQQALDTFAEIEDVDAKTRELFTEFVDFARGFRDALSELRGPAIDLTEALDLIGQGALSNASNLTRFYLEFLDRTSETFGEASTQYEDATEAVRVNALAQLGLAQSAEGLLVPLNEVQESLNAGRLRIEEFVRSIDAIAEITLSELGFSTEEISEISSQALATQINNFVGDFAEQLNRAVTVLQDPTQGAVFAVRDIIENSDALYQQATGVVEGIGAALAEQRNILTDAPAQMLDLETQLDTSQAELASAQLAEASTEFIRQLEAEISNIEREIRSLEIDFGSADANISNLGESLTAAEQNVVDTRILAQEQLVSALRDLSVAELETLAAAEDLVGETTVLEDSFVSSAIAAELAARELSDFAEVSKQFVDFIISASDRIADLTGQSVLLDRVAAINVAEINNLFNEIDTTSLTSSVTEAINAIFEVGNTTEDYSSAINLINRAFADGEITQSEYYGALQLVQDATLTTLEYNKELADSYNELLEEITQVFNEAKDDLLSSLSELGKELVNLVKNIDESTRTVLNIYDDTLTDLAESGNVLFDLRDSARSAFEESAKAVREFERANALSGRSAADIRAELESVQSSISNLVSDGNLNFSAFSELAGLTSTQNKLSRELNNLISVEDEYASLLADRESASSDLAFAESAIQTLGESLVDTRRTESEVIQQVQDAVVDFTRAQQDLQSITEILAENNFNLNQIRVDENDRVVQLSAAIAQLNDDTEALNSNISEITSGNLLDSIITAINEQLASAELSDEARQSLLDLANSSTGIINNQLGPLAEAIDSLVNPTQDAVSNIDSSVASFTKLTNKFQQFSDDIIQYLDVEGLSLFYGAGGVFEQFRSSLISSVLTDGFEVLTVSGGPLDGFSENLFNIGQAIDGLVSQGATLNTSFNVLSENGLSLVQAIGDDEGGLSSVFNGLLVTSELASNGMETFVSTLEGFSVAVSDFNSLGITYDPTQDFSNIINSVNVFETSLSSISFDAAEQAAASIQNNITAYNSNIADIVISNVDSTVAETISNQVISYNSTLGSITVSNVNNTAKIISNTINAYNNTIDSISISNVNNKANDISNSIAAYNTTLVRTRVYNANNKATAISNNIAAYNATIAGTRVYNVNNKATAISNNIAAYNTTIAGTRVYNANNKATAISNNIAAYNATLVRTRVYNANNKAMAISNNIAAYNATIGSINVEDISNVSNSIKQSFNDYITALQGLSLDTSFVGLITDESLSGSIANAISNIDLTSSVNTASSTIVDSIEDVFDSIAVEFGQERTNAVWKFRNALLWFNDVVAQLAVNEITIPEQEDPATRLRALAHQFVALRGAIQKLTSEGGVGSLESELMSLTGVIQEAWNDLSLDFGSIIQGAINVQSTSSLSREDSSNLARVANNSGKFVPIDGVTYSTPQAFAEGGMVTGPGTGTSDSIPARLSNGEFVMRASAVKNIGRDVLTQLNQSGDLNSSLAAQGRFGDTLVAHINTDEARALMMAGGAGSRNPKTGLLEFFASQDSGAVGKVFARIEANKLYDVFKDRTSTTGTFSNDDNVYNRVRAVLDNSKILMTKSNMINHPSMRYSNSVTDDLPTLQYDKTNDGEYRERTNLWSEDITTLSTYKDMARMTANAIDLMNMLGRVRGIDTITKAVNQFGLGTANKNNVIIESEKGVKGQGGGRGNIKRNTRTNEFLKAFSETMVEQTPAGDSSSIFSKAYLKNAIDALNTGDRGNFTDFYMLDPSRLRRTEIAFDPTKAFMDQAQLYELLKYKAIQDMSSSDVDKIGLTTTYNPEDDPNYSSYNYSQSNVPSSDPTSYFAGGGLVTGPRDSVSAMLEPGEFVLRKPAVDKMGVAEAIRINSTGETGDTNVEVNIVNNGTAQEPVSQPVIRRENGKIIVDVILEDIRNNGPIKRQIRSIR